MTKIKLSEFKKLGDIEYDCEENYSRINNLPIYKNLKKVLKENNLFKDANKKVWQDVYGKLYTLLEISDTHLVNILNLLSKRNICTPYVTEENINLLKQEAYERGLSFNKHKKETIIIDPIFHEIGKQALSNLKSDYDDYDI